MEEENKRRLFISGAGHPSGVLRAKKDETEEDARARLTEKGWNMEAPHSFDDDKKEFRVTDKKVRKRKAKKPAAAEEGKPEDKAGVDAAEKSLEDKADSPSEEKPEGSEESKPDKV